MKIVRWLLVTALLIVPLLARSQEPDRERHQIDRELVACQEKAPSTAGMVSCDSRARKQWDAEMNAAYRAVLRYLDATGQRDMRASQRAWLAFRDKEYKTITSVHNRLRGTLWVPIQASRLTELTRARALTLRSYEASLKEEQ